MWVPLVVLAVLAVVGGGLNLPFAGSLQVLEHFLEPSFAHGIEHGTVATGTKLALAAVAVVASLAGIGFAYTRWYRREPADNAPLEPAVLKRAWGVDAAYAALIGGPGRRGADLLAYQVDKGGVDGAVNGIATIVRSGGDRLRKVQTGYVRNYALGLAGGAVLVLAYALSRAGL